MIKYRKLIPVLAILAITSCKSKKVVTTKSASKKYTSKKTVPRITTKSLEKKVVVTHKPTESSSSEANKVIRKALSYKGTEYKYGGTTKSGMDCSGLMYSSFKVIDVTLPRTSFEQSKLGRSVSVKSAKKGDLVFFMTNGKRRINHVGLVVSVDGRDVKFVHSSSSRGVMISSLREGYWANAYRETRRFNYSDDQSGSVQIKELSHSEHKTTHTVKQGDTLYSIARRYKGVSVADIMSLNNLKSTTLTLGMTLQIP
ncbi:MAG: C40 family peptidase [Flavobacteriaceae bacterium]